MFISLHERFVRLFVIAGRGPAYSGPQRWDLYVGPMRQPRHMAAEYVNHSATKAGLHKGTDDLF